MPGRRLDRSRPRPSKRRRHPFEPRLRRLDRALHHWSAPVLGLPRQVGRRRMINPLVPVRLRPIFAARKPQRHDRRQRSLAAPRLGMQPVSAVNNRTTERGVSLDIRRIEVRVETVVDREERVDAVRSHARSIANPQPVSIRRHTLLSTTMEPCTVRCVDGRWWPESCPLAFISSRMSIALPRASGRSADASRGVSGRPVRSGPLYRNNPN